MNVLSKPRLVYFQWNHSALPSFLKLHMQLHVKCLSEFFDVVLINQDCDYGQVCDKFQPDLTLFESGYRTSISKRLTIKNTSSHSHIPKLGLHNGDSWCECRTGFISDMDYWGIETYFSICTTTAEHTPALAENLFVWPNFIDSDVFHDYDQPKVVPVLFNGFINPLYPWRQKIYKVISNCYPSLIFPHFGYDTHSPIMIHGEEYARTINASWFVPACGTLAKEVVRKHFEIPGSKSCLITERTPSVEAAGFVDMENCVFADENDVLDKLDYLFQNKVELERIIHSGYELVQTKHTLKQRSQIFQWFNLYKSLKSNEKIVQLGPFEPFVTVQSSKAIKNLHVICNGLNIELLRAGDEKLWACKYDEAELCFLKCLNYIHWMPEPKLKLAICGLFKGKPESAFQLISDTTINILRDYRAVDPDPIEWAYLIITLICQGKFNEAIIRANQFPSLSHPELDRVRWVINSLEDCSYSIQSQQNPLIKCRNSVHQLPLLSLTDWIENLCKMLVACQQFNLAERVNNLIEFKEDSVKELKKKTIINAGGHGNRLLFIRIQWLNLLSFIFQRLHIPNPRPGLPPTSEFDYFVRLGRCFKINSIKALIIKYYLRFKRFVISPNTKSVVKTEVGDLCQLVKLLFQHESVRKIVIIGASCVELIEKVMCELESTNTYQVYCIYNSNGQLLNIKNSDTESNSSTNDMTFKSFTTDLSPEVSRIIKKIKKENSINAFDLTLIDNSDWNTLVDFNEILGANFIFINKINSYQNFSNKAKLLLDKSYTIMDQGFFGSDGYALFKMRGSLKQHTALIDSSKEKVQV
ncbi:hypothetical protein SY85_00795 [Flavisolibacter tropicus]|uniref:Spore protein YkvP/CgeB glycosyl transferase-like domain-containing protein n=2 Tax=Flavisolibacter tropicus TaxID=1492898 RepID=A0A172U247_9BACT|nr:hypothetical protein SY85_00795 [Flavisolibacter tropicus]